MMMKKNTVVLSLLLVGLGFNNASYSQNCTNYQSTTPSVDFTDNADGTISHQPTGLMWKVCSEGQTYTNGSCENPALPFKWTEALAQVNTVNTEGYAGYNDWRLPNIKELNALVELSCFDPAINADLFPNTVAARYASSSPRVRALTSLESDMAWVVNFKDGSLPNSGDLSPLYQGEYLRLLRN